MNKLEEQQLKELKQRQDSQHKKEMRKLAKQRRKLANTKLNCSIKNLKELWSYAVFRWCVYQIPPLVFWLVMLDQWWFRHDVGELIPLFWVLILTVPTVWVWRKPIWKAIGFLNKKAEED